MSNLSRRHFIFGSVVATTASARPTASAPRVSANDRVSVAVVGAGGMGRHHVNGLLEAPDAVCATVCDVNQYFMEREAEKVRRSTGKRPRMVKDFRRILDDPSIDALVVATPHHWHIPIAVRALEAGKDVYVEKPASHVFREGRVLVETARRTKRIVQHGTQMRSTEVTARAREVLDSGILGEVKMSKAWNQHRSTHPVAVPDTPEPPGIDYDFWLGPAPKRRFNSNRFKNTWLWYRDYGNGDIGGDGIHDLDMAHFGLSPRTHPIRITAHGSDIEIPGEREFPDNMTVAYEFQEGKVLLYEDRGWTPYGHYGVDSGNIFYGTEGFMVFSRRGFFQVYQGSKEELGPGMRFSRRIGNRSWWSHQLKHHHAGFFESVRTRRQPSAPALQAHLSCALTHLGEVAFRVRRVLEFDPETETVKNDPEANRLLTKEYREPWSV